MHSTGQPGAEPVAPYADITLVNDVGNTLTPERMASIRSHLLHFNWKTERSKLVQALGEMNVYGDVGGDCATFYDYNQQGWVTARLVPR